MRTNDGSQYDCGFVTIIKIAGMTLVVFVAIVTIGMILGIDFGVAEYHRNRIPALSAVLGACAVALLAGLSFMKRK